MKIRTIFLAGALALFGATSVSAQSGEELFQQALVQEQAEGDLRAAIRLYTQIVTDYVLDRPLVARALMRIGAAYDKLGDAAARTAYERIVAEYADQREALRVAQERLRVLDPDGQFASMPPGEEPTFRLLMDPHNYIDLNRIDYSPDGRRYVAEGRKSSGAETTGIFISDVADVGPGVLVGPDYLEGLRRPHWSPDGRHIVFHARRRSNSPPAPGDRGIYVVSEDGSNLRAVATDASGAIWTPSGNLTFPRATDAGGQLVTVDLSGKVVRVIETDERFVLFSYSPDGRWLAIRSSDRRIMIMPAGGGGFRPVPPPADGLRVVHGFRWSLDGHSVYFVASTGPGDSNIQRLDFDPRTGQVFGEPENITSYQGVDVRMPQVLASGDLAYTVTSVTTVVEVVELADDPSRLEERRTVARGTNPKLSPDGSTVYYVGEGYGREGIFAVPVVGGDARRVTSTVPAHGDFLVSPDGATLSFHTHANDDETSLFVLPVKGGQPRLIAQIVGETASAVGTPRWSPDASRLAYGVGRDLLTVPATGGEPRMVAQGTWLASGFITWSPDGNYIAALGLPEGERGPAVFVVPANGGEPRRLTPPEDDTNKGGLSWHPDGERLSYTSWYPDESRMAYLDGRATTSLMNLPGNEDGFGSWAPDGNTYLSWKGSGAWNALIAYDPGTRRTTEILPRGQGYGNVAWAAEGSSFTFHRTRRSSQIWVIEDIR